MDSRYALLIGNSEYDDPALRKLALPEADIQAVAEVLGDPTIGDFEIVGIHINKDKSSVELAIERFFANRNRDDFLLLYFSGHGVKDRRGILHIAFPNTDRNLLRSTAIRDDFVAELMDSSRAEAQLLVLDCCNAAAFGRGAKAETGGRIGIEDTFRAVIQRGVGRMVLAATGSTQFAWEGDEVIGSASNSVFTRWFVEGLRSGEADHDGDGLIALGEFVEYLKLNVHATEPDQNPELHARPNAPLDKLIIATSPNTQHTPEVVQSALDTLPDPPREGLRNPHWNYRYYAIAEAERNLSDSAIGPAVRVVLEFLAENDSQQAVQERAQQALHDFDVAEQQRIAEEKRRAREIEKERERLRSELESELGEQAAAFRQWIDSFYEEAQSLFEAEDWNGAEDALDRLEETYPKDPRIAELRQKIQKGRKAEAVERARHEQIETLIAQTNEFCQAGNWDHAKATLEQVQEFGANDTRIADIGQQIQRGRESEAAKRIRREKVESLLARASESISSGNWDNARHLIEEALRIHPDLPKAQRQLALVRERIEREADRKVKIEKELKRANRLAIRKWVTQNFRNGFSTVFARLSLRVWRLALWQWGGDNRDIVWSLICCGQCCTGY